MKSLHLIFLSSLLGASLKSHATSCMACCPTPRTSIQVLEPSLESTPVVTFIPTTFPLSPRSQLQLFMEKHRTILPEYGISDFQNVFQTMPEDQWIPMMGYITTMAAYMSPRCYYQISRAFSNLNPSEKLLVASYVVDKVSDLRRHQEMEFFILNFKNLPREKWDEINDLKTKTLSILSGKNIADILECTKTISHENRIAFWNFLLDQPSIKNLNIHLNGARFAKVFDQVTPSKWADHYTKAETILRCPGYRWKEMVERLDDLAETQ